jgi:hypothetical protein
MIASEKAILTNQQRKATQKEEGGVTSAFSLLD